MPRRITVACPHLAAGPGEGLEALLPELAEERDQGGEERVFFQHTIGFATFVLANDAAGAIKDIVDCIEMFHNNKRQRSLNDLLSPLEYEQRFKERLASV